MDELDPLFGYLVATDALQIDRAQLAPLPFEPDGATDVADAPVRGVVLDGASRPRAILFLSRPVSPGHVGRAVDRAEEARRLLGDAEMGCVILSPLASGTFEGLSYACWPWRQNLSRSKYIGFVQRQLLAPKVLSWLREATTQALHTPTEAETAAAFVQPLERMATDSRFSTLMRGAAAEGLHRLERAEWTPVQTLQHGDFWIGNVLLADRTSSAFWRRYGFHIIDWGGARIPGYPICDFVRFGMSTRIGQRRAVSEFSMHCRLLGCQPRDAVHYVLASLGELGTHLEHYPEHRYVEAGHRTYERVQALVQSTENK